MATKTLVVLDRLASHPRRLRLAHGLGDAILLSLTPRQDHLQELADLLDGAADRLEIVHGASHLDRIAEELRLDYARLVAAAADRIEFGRKPLREAYTFERRLSLWWLNEIFGKRSDLYPGFTRLCQLELVRRLAERQRPDELLLITLDPSLWSVTRTFCGQHEIRLRGRRPSGRGLWRRRSALPRVILSSLVWLGRAAVQTLVARTVARPAAPQGPAEIPLCAFHTIYPSLWKGGRSPTDERYGEVPRLLQQGGRLRSLYACTFSADGKHQHVTGWQFVRLCRWLRKRRREPGQIPIALIDGYLRPRDLLAAAAQLRLIPRYLRLSRSRSFRDHWVLRGLAFHPLLREELRAAMVRTPRYLLHALRVRRFVQELRPQALVYYHFEFGLGRAIAFGALTGDPRTALVGVQDGAVAKLKLWSTNAPGELGFEAADRVDFLAAPPVPDLALLEGRSSWERFVEAGYPGDRLRVVGAPRVLALSRLPRFAGGGREGVDRTSEERFVVLVVLGGNDADSLLAALPPALALGPRLHLLIKLHPRAGPSQAEAERRLAATAPVGSPRASWSVEAGDVYRLLPRADLVLATYSSVALEAAALGYPVVCLALPDRISATPLRELAAANVRFAATSEELADELRRRAESPPARELPGRPDLGEYFFTSLDGSSPRRWARAIEEYLLGSEGEAGERS